MLKFRAAMRDYRADPNPHTVDYAARVAEREDRSEEILSCLKDRFSWNKVSESDQDLAIRIVANRIANEGYEYFKTRWFISHNEDEPWSSEEPTTSGSKPWDQCVRIGQFIKKPSGVVLNLLPINGGLLFSQTVLSKRHGSLLKNKDHGYVFDSDVTWPNDLPLVGIEFSGLNNRLIEAGLRLPTGSEWSTAMLAGVRDTIYYFGNSINNDHVWHRLNSGAEIKDTKTHLESESWNSFGLVDMVGNVDEYVTIDPESSRRSIIGGNYNAIPNSEAFDMKPFENACLFDDRAISKIGVRVVKDITR